MAEEWLKIRNWDKWQSYRKDRGQPPWIKIHRQLMRDPNWVELSAEERGELVCIWLLGADRDGVIPSDPEIVRKLCYLDTTPDLKKLVSLRFLELDRPRTEEEDGEEANGAEGKVYFIRYQQAIKIGFSKNPWARLAALKTAMPFEPELLGHVVATKNDEVATQKRLSKHNTNREWFQETPEVKAFIQFCLTTGKLPPTTWRHTDAPEAETEKIREETEENTSASAEVCPETGETPAPSRPLNGELTEFVFECDGKGGKSWTLPKSKMDEYLACYPSLDVRAEIRKARQWIRDNPTKRKTVGGMPAFLTRWLNNAQNSGGNHVGNRGRPGPQIGPGQRYDPDAKGGGTF